MHRTNVCPPIRVVAIAGIRSQYLKLAALQRGAKAWNSSSPDIAFNLISVNSGQHYTDSLSSQYFDEYSIAFDHDLTGSFSSADPDVVLGEMITFLTSLLRQLKSEVSVAMVFGDGNTTLAGAVAARRAGVPLIHVEAGLRTHQPTIEEMNRVVADHLASFRTVSSWVDWVNLEAEGLAEGSVFTGDIVRDLVTLVLQDVDPPNEWPDVVATLHREENIRDDAALHHVFQVLTEQGLKTLFIAHPRVLNRARQVASGNTLVSVRESCGHMEICTLIEHCRFLVTDSGALQREAFYLGKRAVVVQDSPFWIGLIDAGIHRKTAVRLDELREAVRWALQEADRPMPEYDDFGTPPVSHEIIRHTIRFAASIRA